MTSDGVLDKDEAEALRIKYWKRRGLLLQDERVLEAMGGEAMDGRLPFAKNKDGQITGDIADVLQMRKLRDYLFRLLSQMVDDIASGCVEPNPYTRGSSHNACAFCPYGAICHKNTVEGRRNYKAMTSQRFWDEITKELKTDG